LLAGFGSIALFLIVAVLFAATMVLIPAFLRTLKIVPKKPNPVKNSNFECGMQTIGKTLVRFNFRYYFYALMFIALDVLVVFLYPWATGLRQTGYFGLVAILIFVLLIIIGFTYAWKKKVLEWK
jgi:NADH-quinone oxidoreductase subunit A